MKSKIGVIALIAVCMTITGLNTAQAQDQEVEQLILDVQKLSQFKQILSDMKTAYVVIMKGYKTVRDLSQGDFNLHKVFLDGLMAVSPAVKNYNKAADIVSMLLEIPKEYKSAYNHFKSGNLFNWVNSKFMLMPTSSAASLYIASVMG